MIMRVWKHISLRSASLLVRSALIAWVLSAVALAQTSATIEGVIAVSSDGPVQRATVVLSGLNMLVVREVIPIGV
jgi:hypothetical protein